MLDVTSEESIQNAADVVNGRHPDGIFGLVNNAGINVGPYPIEGVDMNDVSFEFAAPLDGPHIVVLIR